MTYWSIRLVRKGEPFVELGTVPSEDDFDDWFTGAFASGVLPDPPRYTDEIQAWEHALGRDGKAVMKFVWRLSWHQFIAKQVSII